MAITSWTSDGMTWPIAAGYPLLPYAEALRLALVERLTAAGVGVDALLSAPITAGNYPGGSGWGLAFAEAMDGLSDRFVNHTDSGGDWNGEALADTAPLWDMAAMLAYLSESEQPQPARFRPMTAAWANQQYRLLNLMRWTDAGFGTNYTAQRKLIAGEADYAAAVAAFDAAPWETYGTATRPWPYALVNVGGTASATAGRGIWTWTVPATLSHRMAVYLHAARPDSASSEYDEPYFGLAEGVTTKWLDESTSTASASRTLTLFDSDLMLVGAPVGASERGFDMRLPTTGARAFFRWDVPGGFSFIT